jgi:predicted nucleotidyltransferase
MVYSIDEIRTCLTPVLKERNVKSAVLFGSYSKGEADEDSDIDLLVDTSPGTTLFDLGGLHEDLADLLGVSVDIISSGGRMHEYMRMSIEKDARPYV